LAVAFCGALLLRASALAFAASIFACCFSSLIFGASIRACSFSAFLISAGVSIASGCFFVCRSLGITGGAGWTGGVGGMIMGGGMYPN
jgi:hypothetical protein